MPKYFYDHVHLIASDPVKAAEFYEKAFGAKRVSVTPGPDGTTAVELSLTGTRLLIRNAVASDARAPDSPRKHLGLEHWGIRTDNIDVTAKNLKAMGVQFVQEVTEARPGMKMAFVMAPDNVLIEILEIK